MAHKFGWSLPPGVTSKMLDEAVGAEHPCETCGEFTSDCICPECPQCHCIGDPGCYIMGFLDYTTTQLVGQARLHITQLESQLDSARYALAQYLTQLEKETKGDNGPKT